jgi:hypothetical protein
MKRHETPMRGPAQLLVCFEACTWCVGSGRTAWIDRSEGIDPWDAAIDQLARNLIDNPCHGGSSPS